ncbi:MAG: SAM-dependent methyltransferase [Chloroflexi bacterium]|nr:SAM-dependent methyltransferase [Chloroflexota bacterium]
MSNQTLKRNTAFEIFPVGHVRRDNGRTYIEILKAYAPALKELEQFSHVQVFWWFSEYQDDVYRGITQSEHAPYDAPTLGMFACRSPVRPNPIGLSTTKVLNVDHDAGEVEITSIDTFDDTPVLDLKPYIPVCDRLQNVNVPDWASDWPEWAPDEGPKLEDQDTSAQ